MNINFLKTVLMIIVQIIIVQAIHASDSTMMNANPDLKRNKNFPCVTQHTEVIVPDITTDKSQNKTWYLNLKAMQSPVDGGVLCPGQYMLRAMCSGSTPSVCANNECAYSANLSVKIGTTSSLHPANDISGCKQNGKLCENLIYITFYFPTILIDTAMNSQYTFIIFTSGGRVYDCIATAIQTTAY